MRKFNILAKLCIYLMLCAFITPALTTFAEGGTPYKDVPTNIDRDYKYSLNALYKQGIFTGRADDEFGYGDTINRAEIATVVTRILGIDTFSVDLNQNPFKDIDINLWYAVNVIAAKQNNVMKGDEFDATFRPGDAILDVEALAVAVRLFNLENQIQTTSPWYQGYLDFANQNDLLRDPLAFGVGQITREDFALLVYRFQQEFDQEQLIDFGGLPFPAGNTDNVTVSAFTPNGTPKDWTFMVYMNGDNNLEPFALADLNEMETVGSNENLNILVQIDRIPGYDDTNEDFTDTRRYYVKPDNDTSTVKSEQIGQSYEANMGSAQDLADFIKWGVTNYPAENYALVLWNHGGTWFSSSNDETDNYNGMTIMGITNALKAVTEAGNFKFGVIDFDMCLMGQLEVAAEIAPYADYMVSSEEFEPGDGNPYHLIMPIFKTKPNISAKELSETWVEKYYESYKDTYSEDLVTFSSIDLQSLSSLKTKFNNFAKELRELNLEGMKTITAIRQTVPEFSSDGGFQSFDLFQFAEITSELTTLPSGLTSAAAALATQIQTSVIKMGNGPAYSTCGGVSFYFPPPASLAEEYLDTDLAKTTEWDEFLGINFKNKLAEQVQNVEPNVDVKSSLRAVKTNKTTKGKQADETIYDLTAELNTYGSVQIPFTVTDSISSVYFFVGAYAPSNYGNGYTYSLVYLEELYPDETDQIALWQAGKEYQYNFNGYIPQISNGSTNVYAPMASVSQGSNYKAGDATLNSQYGAANYSSPILNVNSGKIENISLYGNVNASSYLSIEPPSGGTIFYYQYGVDEFGEEVYYPTQPLTIGSQGLYSTSQYIPNGIYTLGVIALSYDESVEVADFIIGEVNGSSTNYNLSDVSSSYALLDPILADEYYVESYMTEAYNFSFDDPYLTDYSYSDLYLSEEELYAELALYFMYDFEWYCQTYSTSDPICTPYAGWTEDQWINYWNSLTEEEFWDLYYEFYWYDYSDYYCVSDLDCLSGEMCSYGVCAPISLDCYSDYDCYLGETCISGVCTQDEIITPDSDTYSISGLVTEATTGVPLFGVEVYISDSLQTSTDTSGYFYIAHVPAGDNLIQYSLDGYFDLSQQITVDSALGTLSASLSPEISVNTPEELRFVLTWGENPPDLDAHLMGPENGGGTFHVYYTDPISYYAVLDVDDMSSYGPETITLESRLDTGKYLFYIQNFSGEYITPLSTSSATVNVYNSTGLINTFNVPTLEFGAYWKVFEIDTAGNIVPINTISDSIDTSEYYSEPTILY